MAEKKKKATTKKNEKSSSKNTNKKANNVSKKKTTTSKKKTTVSKKVSKNTTKNVTKPTTKKVISSKKNKNVNEVKNKSVSKKSEVKFEKAELKKDFKECINLPKLSNKVRKRFIVISIICLILAIILMIPYGITNYQSEASGKILDIPKLSKLSEECCMYSATFKSPRSYSSLKSELEKIMDSYEKLNCEGKEYYYNKEEDFTITEYGLQRGFVFNSFYITYGAGNSCEIDTTLKNIEMLPDDYSLADAKKDGNYVIEGDKVFNEDSYDKFLKDVEQNIPSTLRIATVTKEGDLVLTDLKYLSDGKYKVVYDGTRDRTNKEDDRVILAYKYEHIGIYKDKLYAYNGKKITKSMLKTDDVYYLFDIEKSE